MPGPTVTKLFRKFADIFMKVFGEILLHGLAKNSFQSFLTSLEFFSELFENSHRIYGKFAEENFYLIFAKNYFSEAFPIFTS